MHNNCDAPVAHGVSVDIYEIMLYMKGQQSIIYKGYLLTFYGLDQEISKHTCIFITRHLDGRADPQQSW